MFTEFDPGQNHQEILRSDGAVLIAAGGSLTLFTSVGDVDATFGVNGRVELPGELEGLPLGISSYAFDTQGRILVFGRVSDPNQFYVDPYLLRSFEATWAVVMRLLPNGAEDGSFGQGKGFVRSDFGLRTTVMPREPGMSDPQIPTTSIGAGVVDSQDRPVLVAESLAPVDGRCFFGKGFMSPFPKAVVRLTSAGSLDPAFGGGDGIADIGGGERGASLQMDSTDGPVIATNKRSCKQRDNVFRYGADGLPVASFGNAGVRLYPGLAFGVTGPMERLTLGGSVRTGKRLRPAVIRALPSGSLDQAFGNGGKAAFDLPSGAERQWMIAGVDSQSRTVVVGTFDLPKPKKKGQTKSSRQGTKSRGSRRSYLFVKRLLSNGKIDRALGSGGNIITQFERPLHLRINGAVLDRQGRLVVLIGSNDGRQPAGARLTIARYTLGR